MTEGSAVVVGDVDIGIAVAVVVIERHAGAVQPDVGDPALCGLLGKPYRNARLAGFVARLPEFVARLASTKQDPRGYRNGADAKIPFHQSCSSTRAFYAAGTSKGSVRRRLPSAANIALPTAGAAGGTPTSPMPPIGAPLLTTCTRISGVSFMSSIL